MNKTGLIISREYFSRVKKKSFLLTTILVPLVIVAFYAIIIVIAVSGRTTSQSFAIIDDAGLFDKAPEGKNAKEFTLIKNETEESFKTKYQEAGYDAFVYIPPMHIDTPKNLIVHSKSTVGLSTSYRLEGIVNKAIEDKRLIAYGIDPVQYNKINSNISMVNTIEADGESKESNAGIAYAISYACGILIYMMMLIYGTMVMRGVMEEKTNRIAEVIVSSVKPFQLMLGKIFGIGAVGLTQFAIWIIIFLLVQMTVPMIFPDLFDTAKAANAGMGGMETGEDKIAGLLQSVAALPLTKIFLLFIFYFIGGYLTYASLFAAVGSAVSDDQADSQQLILPVMMPIILGFVILTRAVEDPNSSIAVFGSLFPLTSPIVMMGRLTSDVPLWEILVSMALLIGCFFFLTWVTAKIYRTGILMYGKKPSWKEMLKWAFRK